MFDVHVFEMEKLVIKLASTFNETGDATQREQVVKGYHSNLHYDFFSTSTDTARSHAFVEIDHEILSTVILLPSADSFKKGCCQLQAKVCARITGYSSFKDA